MFILVIKGIVPYVLGYLLAMPILVVGVLPIRFAYMTVTLRIAHRLPRTLPSFIHLFGLHIIITFVKLYIY